MSREVEIARPVVSYLQDLQWDVYQEVQCGKRADIVGLQGRLFWVVEVKASLTFEVIAQAHNWLDHAHYVSIAVPAPKWEPGRKSAGRHFAYRVCRHYGIGVLEVEADSLREVAKPKFGRTRIISYFAEGLRASCVPECKTWGEAGNALSKYYTPFRGTCENIRRELGEQGPMTTRQVVEAVDHHYSRASTARSCLFAWASQGKIPGVYVDTSVRPALWRLVSPTLPSGRAE